MKDIVIMLGVLVNMLCSLIILVGISNYEENNNTTPYECEIEVWFAGEKGNETFYIEDITKWELDKFEDNLELWLINGDYIWINGDDIDLVCHTQD